MLDHSQLQTRVARRVARARRVNAALTLPPGNRSFRGSPGSPTKSAASSPREYPGTTSSTDPSEVGIVLVGGKLQCATGGAGTSSESTSSCPSREHSGRMEQRETQVGPSLGRADGERLRLEMNGLRVGACDNAAASEPLELPHATLHPKPHPAPWPTPPHAVQGEWQREPSARPGYLRRSSHRWHSHHQRPPVGEPRQAGGEGGFRQDCVRGGGACGGKVGGPHGQDLRRHACRV